VAGDATFNSDTSVLLNVACGSVTSCVAVGFYSDPSGTTHGFIVEEVAGRWRAARDVPGLDALNTAGHARVNVVACATAGWCAAGGYYLDASTHYHAFVVNEANGLWQTALAVPGTPTISNGGNAQVTAIACGSKGSCAAGGYVNGGSNHQQPFVVNEIGGSWGLASVLVNDTGFNAGGKAQITALACGAPGSCSAGGFYRDGFAPIEVPGTASLNTSGANLNDLACSSAGQCSAGGYVTGTGGREQPFLVNEINGTWGLVNVVVNDASGAANTKAEVEAISCSPGGGCSAGGYFTATGNHLETFVLDKVANSWQQSGSLPGSVALNAGHNASVTALSCPTTTFCGAIGTYADGSGQNQVFVANRAGAPSAPQLVHGAAAHRAALVSWHPPASNGGVSLAGYLVIAAGSSRTCATTGKLSCVVTGLVTGHTYRFEVVARGVAGHSAPSALSAPVTVR
jgi:hypothetical protein